MTDRSPPMARVLDRLKGVRQSGGQWEALCPAHEDKSPSLSLSEGADGRILTHCHAGCQVGDIVRAIGLELRDLFATEAPRNRPLSAFEIVTSYDYLDEEGRLRYQVCRLPPQPKNPKPFLQRRKHNGAWVMGLKAGRYKRRRSGHYSLLKKSESEDGVISLPEQSRILYRLPSVLEGLAEKGWIVVCEGEKDADNGAALGLTTTTNPGGAGKWRSSFSEVLKGARVAVIPDNDPVGVQSAESIAMSLHAAGAEVRMVKLEGEAKGFDLSDWIELQRTESRSSEEIRELLISKIESAPVWEPAGDGKKPAIRVGTNEMLVVDMAVVALANRCEVFHRGGCLVHVVREEVKARGIVRPPSAPTIQPVAPARIREVLSDAATWISEKGRQIHPPQWAVQALLARGKWTGLRPLEGIVEAPVVRPDGSILQEPGYDEETGLVFVPNGRFFPIQTAPSQSEAAHAAKTILDAVADFPFSTEAHRSAWLSSVLTILSRFAFAGPSPLHLFDANVRGAGKSLLADVTAMITLGRSAARMAPSENEAEERKRITALALAGDPLILIDNVSGMLGSAPLDAALTGSTWVDRLLGQNLTVSLPLVATWLATGNNVTLKGDTSRRSLHIRLDSPEEFPEQRDGFRHPRLLEWVSEKRPELVAAALKVLSGYFRAGRPDQGLSPWGSFEGWSSLIRNAIVWAGQPDPGDTRQALQTDADRDRELLERLLRGWTEAVTNVGRPISASEAITRLQAGGEGELSILRSAVIELCSSPGQLPSPRVLGNRLKKFRGRVIQGQALRAAGKSKFGMTWAVQDVANTTTIGDSMDSGDSSENQGSLWNASGCRDSGSDGLGEESPESAESPTQIGMEVPTDER